MTNITITLGKEFERRITGKVSNGLYKSASEVIRDGLRLLFEKDTKGFEQLAAGESSKNNVMDIFEQATLAIDSKSTSKAANVEL